MLEDDKELTRDVDDYLDILIGEIPLYKKEKEWIDSLYKSVLNKPIEKDNPHKLKDDMAKLNSYLAYAGKLKSKSVALYRLAKLKAAEKFLKGEKADERKAIIEGHSAQYKYLSEYMESVYDSLKERQKSSISILSMLKQEMQNEE